MRCTLCAENNAALRRKFLALPKQLYPVERLTQDAKTERLLLLGRHPLSGDFSVYPFLALDESGEAVSRCLLTVYPGDENGYVGFFESEDDSEAAALVLEAAAERARRLGCRRMVGPYNASFWLGYRFKTSGFRSLFTGEPNNRPYYPRLWERCGFVVTDHYFSNHMRAPVPSDENPKARKRLETFRAAGYDFRTITWSGFDASLREIYALLTRLYRTFPGYRPITEGQFFALFSPLRYVLDFEMVKLVYRAGELVAFVICVPNYGNLTNLPFTPRVLRELLRLRRAPAEYVIPYMGVAPECAGLGNALSELLRQDLQRKGCPSVSALIHDGKVTGGFYKTLKIGQSDYVLMARELTEEKR